MIQPAHQNGSRLGFITVIETPGLGFSGGLLIVNAHGRPIEFHCTASTKVNRAQKILYGRTYQSFLFCEQIAASLLDNARTQPGAYVTDQVDLMPLSKSVSPPVLLMQKEPDSVLEEAGLHHFQLDDRRLWFDSLQLDRAEPVKSICEQFCRTLPIDEPMERIREAISEAQATARSQCA